MEQPAETLSPEHRVVARRILEHVRAEIERMSDDDPEVLFAVRRYIHARLKQDERQGPPQRLKLRKFDQQQGHCAICKQPFTQLSGTHLHRIGPGGYTEENTQLVHAECHSKLQGEKPG